MTIKFYKFWILLLAFSSLMLINSQTVQGDEYSPRDVSIKAKLSESNGLTGDTFWTILHEEKGVLVTTSDNGVIVIRFDFVDHDKCYDTPNTFCLRATITDTKNTYFTEPGDEATIIMEYPDNLTFSILRGNLVANTFDLEISKIWQR